MGEERTRGWLAGTDYTNGEEGESEERIQAARANPHTTRSTALCSVCSRVHLTFGFFFGVLTMG